VVTIIDYGMGNLGSVANMIKRIGYSVEITSDVPKIELAKKIILPGVGHFDKAIQNIKSLGIYDVIRDKALYKHTPLLGICLGMQLLCQRSEEGSESGLGLIDAEVKKFSFKDDQRLKIPHMGWNLVNVIKDSGLLYNMFENPRFYFVHSYHVVCNEPQDILTTSTYGYLFHSSLAHGNILGVQFHPEKSHKFGMLLLKNFIEKF
jgi:imidazole glycerol-phosphate synthase subunit HisH